MKIPEIEMVVRYKNGVKPMKKFNMSKPEDAFHLAREIFNSDTILWKEEAIIICLNCANNVIGYHKISSGGIDATIMDVRVIAQISLLNNASAVIIAHNHPSGNLKPSEYDKTSTNKIKNGLELLRIKLLDHLIIDDSSFFSFANEGLI